MSTESAPAQRKRRWRRRQDRPCITARLILDDHAKGDIGIVSDDLFADLFPHLLDEQVDTRPTDQQQQPRVFHIALAPWAPNSTPSGTRWTIVPVVKSSDLSHSTVQFSPSSLSLQTFATILQQLAPSKLSSHSRGGIEIVVLDVSVLELEAVFVNAEVELVKRLENGEGTFFRDHPRSKGKGLATDDSPIERLASALRVALGTLHVVHDGDLFPLPLPPHPVTHVPPPPGQVILCEPVAQGILGPNTRIILTKGRQSRTKHDRKAIHPPRNLNGTGHDEDDDTANDSFYSAAEDRERTDVTTDATDAADAMTETETEMSDAENEEEVSDDSLDDIISLQTPTLPTTNASGISTMQGGTPLTVTRGRKPNGISSPRSVFSSFTATTARASDRPKGRLFKTQGLAISMPSDFLHPKPSPDDDQETRVYVDIASLTRIGCFSGDWVRLEASDEPPSHGLGLYGLGSFGNLHADESIWRPVRVFGLPEGYSHRPMTRIPSSKHDNNGARRLSFFNSQIQKPSGPTAYLSPLLLANMDGAPYVRLSPLKRLAYPPRPGQAKITGSSRPPYAKEVTIQQIRSPVSSERALQNVIFGGLKHHLARCIRVVKTADIIGIPVDTQLGRSLEEAPGAGDGSNLDDLIALSALDNSSTRPTKPDGVAWFKIGHIQRHQSETNDDEDEEEDIWNGVACIDTSMTQIMQSGAITSTVPGTQDSNWPCYLGLEQGPKSPTSAVKPAVAEQARKFILPVRRRLRELIAAATSKRAIHLKMQPIAILLVSTQRNIGKATAAAHACADLGVHTFSIDAYDIVNEAGTGGSDVKTEGFLKARVDRAMSCGADCCALLVRHVEALTADRMATAIKEVLNEARVLIATTTEVDKVSDGVRGLFTHELEINAPDEGEREGILSTIIDNQDVPVAPEVDLAGVAVKTAALVAGDLVDVVDRALVARQSRLEALANKASSSSGKSGGSGGSDESSVTMRDIQVAGGASARCLTKVDFDVAVDAARKNFADAIGAPKIPNVTWDDVGGLNNVKDAVQETIQLPLERPELFAKGMKKRSGILFYGPPGTGKTLLAKAIATEYSLNFFSVKGPELLNMYIGESEANVRRVFQRARDARPCVVFFDELDSVAPKRGNQGDSGGVMDRIVSQLLAELDGMSGGDDGGGGVFVIGATNRPDLLDQALLRPGRFDKMLYLGVSDAHEKQLKILEALTRKFTLHPALSLTAVAQSLPFTYTGADFYALCSDAMLKAVTRQASAVDAKIQALNEKAAAENQDQDQNQSQVIKITTANFFDHYATPEDIAVMVTERDFSDAHRELVPSVSAVELKHYETVRATFEGSHGAGGKPPLQQQQQQQQPRRKGSSSSMSGGGAGISSKGKGKGKGKAIASGEYADDGGGRGGEDGGYLGVVNGSHGVGAGSVSSGKGKGKAVARFQDGTASDDEGLY